MRQMILPTEQAIGLIARHNISDERGHKLVAKGRRLDAGDITRLREHGIDTIAVVRLEADDMDENQAADVVATRIAGAAIRVRPAHHGRADVQATQAGMLMVDEVALQAWHTIAGVTIATRLRHTAVTPGQRVATVKILPFALPAAQVTAGWGVVVSVRPFVRTRVAVLLVGTPASYPRLRELHLVALQRRLQVVTAEVVVEQRVLPAEAELSQALQAVAQQADLVITLSETSIMGHDDVIPQAIERAGGVVTCYGAPVEPGNLLLLAQMGTVPILGAPGCVRSRMRNVVDMVLPRLVADDVPSARDIYALGHGGLLDVE